MNKSCAVKITSVTLMTALLSSQTLALSPELRTGGSEMERMNYFASRVAEDAVGAFRESDLSKMAYRLGYLEKEDVNYLTQQFARSGIRELPTVTYENNMMVFKVGTRVATLEIKDAEAKDIHINGVAYRFHKGKNLQETFEMNYKDFRELVEKSDEEMALMNKIFPSAHANLWGWAAGIALIAIPLVLSIGKKGDAKEGTKNWWKRTKHLGKAVFWEGPKSVFNDGVETAHDKLKDASKNLYDGKSTDH